MSFNPQSYGDRGYSEKGGRSPHDVGWGVAKTNPKHVTCHTECREGMMVRVVQQVGGNHRLGISRL